MTALNKNIPVLRFNGFDNEWERPKLSERMEIFRGASPRPQGDPRYYGGSIPRLMIQDVTRDGKYAYPKIDFLTEEGAKKSRFLKKGSIVLSCSGTRVAIPGILGVDACIHDGWLAFKNFKNVDTDFLYNLFVKLHERMQGSATTGGVFNNLTTSIVRDLRMGFPSLAEQQKIASFLSSVDEKIQQLIRKKELLEQYKKGVMQQLFSGKLRFKDENGKAYPEWEEKSLIEICDINPLSDQLPESFIYIDLESVVKGQLIQEKRISKNEAPSRAQRKLHPNDILYQTVRPYQMNNYLFEKTGDYVASTGYAQIRTNQNIHYIFQMLHSEDFVNEVIERCTGTSFPVVNSKDLGKIKVPVPYKNEQQKIASFLTAIDVKIERVNNQIGQTKTFKKGLLQQMFV
jgi:type I restriction enzyme S subunit